jgi:glycosyltransferase involved in cell wall biosynthesis
MHCFGSKDRKVRVIHLGEVAGLGGLQNWVCSLAEAQARRGFEVQLMQPPWMSPDREVFSDLPVHTWDLKRTRGFDVVHAHGLGGFQNSKIRTEFQPPIIVQTYYGSILGTQIALRWFQNLVGWSGFDVLRNIARDAISGHAADAVIAISPKVRSEIIRLYGIRKKKISVIPGGYSRDIDDTSKRSLRQRLHLPDSGFLFLFVGRADPVKNFRDVLAAFHLTKSQFPNAGLVLAPKQDLHPSEGIFCVELPPQKMNQLYRSVDALIHPSLYDGYSLAVHEAMANGLAVIVGRNAGIAEYCTHRVDALILPGKRGASLVPSLSRMMSSLIESENLCLALGKEASTKFSVMDWDWVAKETEKVYASL